MVGIIFAILITKVSRLKITGYKKGLIEGIIMGIAVFLVLYILTTLVLIQPQLHILMSQNNPGLSQIQAFQENMPIARGIGFLAHIIYGVALGDITTFLSRIKRVEGQIRWNIIDH